MPAALEIQEDRAVRTAAFREVQQIVAEARGGKLHDDEAAAILWAAEGLLLAPSYPHPTIGTALSTFNTLMEDLEDSRWERGSNENPAEGMLLRWAIVACIPGPAPCVKVRRRWCR